MMITFDVVRDEKFCWDWIAMKLWDGVGWEKSTGTGCGWSGMENILLCPRP